jgi:hypothetical protein
VVEKQLSAGLRHLPLAGAIIRAVRGRILNQSLWPNNIFKNKEKTNEKDIHYFEHDCVGGDGARHEFDSP